MSELSLKSKNLLEKENYSSFEVSNEIDNYHSSISEGLKAKKAEKETKNSNLVFYSIIVVVFILIGIFGTIGVQTFLKRKDEISEAEELLGNRKITRIKPESWPKIKIKPRVSSWKFRKLCVAGTGTMGATVAKIFAERGYQTLLYGRTSKSIDRARRIIGDKVLKKMKTTNDLNDLADCDLINESIAENLETKKEFWAKVSKIVKRRTICTTNTSGISINAIAEVVTGKNRFLGMHWFNPSNIIPLIEIIYNDKTEEEFGKAVYQLSMDLGKKPVFCKKDVPGFIANRIQFAILRESMDIVEKGIASAKDVDGVMKYGLGFRLAAYGPLEVADFGGLDTFYHISEYLNKDLCDKKEPMKMLKDLFDAGKFGVKTGSGIYEYPGEKAKQVVEVRNKKYEDMKKLNYKWDNEDEYCLKSKN